LQKLEPSFTYDDFEETWDSNKGVFIETDPLTNIVKWISIYIPELFNEDFNEGLW
jgi:hypothetical protein